MVWLPPPLFLFMAVQGQRDVSIFRIINNFMTPQNSNDILFFRVDNIKVNDRVRWFGFSLQVYWHESHYNCRGPWCSLTCLSTLMYRNGVGRVVMITTLSKQYIRGFKMTKPLRLQLWELCIMHHNENVLLCWILTSPCILFCTMQWLW